MWSRIVHALLYGIAVFALFIASEIIGGYITACIVRRYGFVCPFASENNYKDKGIGI
jgi:hypothetical protein